MSKYNGLCFEREENERFESLYNNNCYTYAINQPLNPYTNQSYEDYDDCQPGHLGGKGKLFRPKTEEEYITYIDLAKSDLQKIGYEIIKSSHDEYIEEANCWKVAFCYGGEDYHWYRQNEDGTWSHKRGKTIVANYDMNGDIILNPEICDRGKYEHFGGFYLIKKKNNIEEVKVA